MNRDEVLRYWMNCFSSIEVSDYLVPELVSLIAESGSESAIFRILIMRITMLQSLTVNAVQHKEFESIGDGLFSMHLAGKGFNIRILYSFLPDRSPVLLLAFYERGGKRKTDYSEYIAPALSRLNKIREEYNHVTRDE